MVRVRSGPICVAADQSHHPHLSASLFPILRPIPRAVEFLPLVGEADQVGFYLTPGGVHDVNGTYSVNVHWQGRNPCP